MADERDPETSPRDGVVRVVGFVATTIAATALSFGSATIHPSSRGVALAFSFGCVAAGAAVASAVASFGVLRTLQAGGGAGNERSGVACR